MKVNWESIVAFFGNVIKINLFGTINKIIYRKHIFTKILKEKYFSHFLRERTVFEIDLE